MEVGPETRTLGAAHGTSAPVTPVAGNRPGNGRLARSAPLSRKYLAGETGAETVLRANSLSIK